MSCIVSSIQLLTQRRKWVKGQAGCYSYFCTVPAGAETTPKAVIRQFFYVLPAIDSVAAIRFVFDISDRFSAVWTAIFNNKGNFP